MESAELLNFKLRSGHTSHVRHGIRYSQYHSGQVPPRPTLETSDRPSVRRHNRAANMVHVHGQAHRASLRSLHLPHGNGLMLPSLKAFVLMFRNYTASISTFYTLKHCLLGTIFGSARLNLELPLHLLRLTRCKYRLKNCRIWYLYLSISKA